MNNYPKPEQITGEEADTYREEHEGTEPPHTWFITDEYGYTETIGVFQNEDYVHRWINGEPEAFTAEQAHRIGMKWLAAARQARQGNGQ